MDVKRRRAKPQGFRYDEQRETYADGVRKERAQFAAEGREDDVQACNAEIAAALGLPLEKVAAEAPAITPEGVPDVVPDAPTWPPHPSTVNASSIARPTMHTDMRISPDGALALLALVDREIDRLGVRGAPLCERGSSEQVLPSVRNQLVRSMMSAHPGRMYPTGERIPLSPGMQLTGAAFEHDDLIGFDDTEKIRPIGPGQRDGGKLIVEDPGERKRKERIEREEAKRAKSAGHV